MTAYVYPVSFVMLPELASDPDGLFAHRLPHAYTSFEALRAQKDFADVDVTCSPSVDVLCAIINGFGTLLCNSA